MCDVCSTDKTKFELLLNDVLTSTPQLHWLFNGFKKFRSQLPADIISELETQLSTLAKNVASSNYQITFVTNIVTYIILFIVVLFLFLCIIFQSDTLTYLLMALSLILIIIGILGIFWYSSNTINSVSLQITSTTNHLKTIFTEALESGLCCINGVDCGNSCTGGCQCENIPNVSFSVVISGLTVTLTDITNPAPIFPVFVREWNFGNGTITPVRTGPSITYTYPQAGTYNITLQLGLSGGCTPIVLPCEPIFAFISPPTTITLT